MASPPPFRIVHLSDLHLTARARDARSEPRLFGRLTGMNAAFRHIARSDVVQQADLLLVTGDVTDTGSLQAWRVFRETLVEASLVRRTLCILGNHDVCALSARAGKRAKLAARDLAKARQGLTISGQPRAYPWHRQVDPRVAVFGIDSNNSGNLTAVTNAIGHVGDHQLDRLGRLLVRHRDVPVKIVLVHHSPNIPHPDVARRRGQRAFTRIQRLTHEIPKPQRRALRRLCGTLGVRLVLHGHLHLGEDRRVDGLRIVGAPASTEPVSRNAKLLRYRVMRYTVRGRGGRVEREVVVV